MAGFLWPASTRIILTTSPKRWIVSFVNLLSCDTYIPRSSEVDTLGEARPGVHFNSFWPLASYFCLLWVSITCITCKSIGLSDESLFSHDTNVLIVPSSFNSSDSEV